MTAKEAFRAMVDRSGYTQRQIAHRMGRHDSYVSQAMARSGITADLLASIAMACGYEMQLAPMDGGDVIVIGDGDDVEHGDRISQAHDLIHRASALLDSLD